MKRVKEAKSVTTRLTGRASDFKPFSKIWFMSGGKPQCKIIGRNPGDIDLEGNRVTAYDPNGEGKQTFDIGSGKFWVQESEEGPDVDKLLEMETVDEDMYLSGPAKKVGDEEKDTEKGGPKKKPGFLGGLFGKKKGEGTCKSGVKESEEDDLGDFDFGEKDADADRGPDMDDEDFSDEDMGDEGPDEEGEDEEEDGDKEEMTPEEEAKDDLMTDIEDAIDRFLDQQDDIESGDLDSSDEDKVPDEPEESVEERRLRKDLGSFLQEEGPKEEVKTPSQTSVQASPVSQVGQPSKPKDDGGDGEGTEKTTDTTMTAPKSSTSGGKPKDEIEGHPGEVTKREGSPDDETVMKGKGPAGSPGLAGERTLESEIRSDLRQAIGLVERGVDPSRLASRVLRGSK